MKPPLKMFVRVLEEQMEEYRAAAGFIRKVTHAIRVLGAAFRCLAPSGYTCFNQDRPFFQPLQFCFHHPLFKNLINST